MKMPDRSSEHVTQRWIKNVFANARIIERMKC